MTTSVRTTRLKNPRLLVLAAAAVLAVLLNARPASADLVVTAQSVSNIPLNSTDNLLFVTVTNTGASAVAIGGFSFGFSVTNTNIAFTSVDTSTTPAYIFAGHSAFGDPIDTTSGAQTIIASDAYDVINQGINLAAGATVGLGRVHFNVLAGASAGAVIPITLTPAPTTSFTNFTGGSVGVPVTLTPGSTITLAGTAAVPEPSVLALAGVAGVLAAARFGCRRVRRAA